MIYLPTVRIPKHTFLTTLDDMTVMKISAVEHRQNLYSGRKIAELSKEQINLACKWVVPTNFALIG